MNFFGLNISRSSPKLKLGEAFVNRSIDNQLRAAGVPIRAAVPHLPLIQTGTNDVATNFNQPMDGQLNGSELLEDRLIRSDPRENWYLTLPEKLVPQQAVNIMRAALGGDIWQQYLLLRMMEDKWPKFRMAAHQLREAVSLTKFNVVPFAEDGEEPTKTAKEKAGLVSRAMKSMNPDPFNDEKGFSGFVYDLTNAMLMGVSITELIWERKRDKKFGPEMLPRAAAFVHPRHFTFTNNGYIAIYDNDYARQYDDPRLQTRNPTLATRPDPDKFICTQMMSMSGSCLGAGLMRPVVWYFVARQWCNEWALNTAKQFGTPFIDITYKPGQSDSSERAKLNAFLKNAGAERRLVHPEGTVATIHPAQSLGGDNPQRYILEESDREVLYLFLGQTSTTIATPGKLGGNDTGQDTKEERVLGLAHWVADTGLNQWARAILRQNYGDDSECPTLHPDRTRPLNSTEVGGLISTVNGSRMPVRADEFYKKIGFTQPEPGDTILQGGEVKEMLTEEEAFDKQLEQQQAVAKLQSQPPVSAKNRDRIANILKAASKKQLAELEHAVTAAERAPHPNGELKLVQQLVTNIERK